MNEWENKNSDVKGLALSCRVRQHQSCNLEQSPSLWTAEASLGDTAAVLQPRWEEAGSKEQKLAITLPYGAPAVTRPQPPPTTHHLPPRNHKTNFPHCRSKTDMKETVVVTSESFSKTFCPKPSICSGKFKWGPNGECFPRVCAAPPWWKGRQRRDLTP